MKYLLQGLLALAVILTLSACGDPVKLRFVSLCSERGGDSETKCSCTFDGLEAQVGEIDEQFVDFVADFAKWGLEDGDEGLDREAIMEKHLLTEEEFKELAGTVGGALLQALSACD